MKESIGKARLVQQASCSPRTSHRWHYIAPGKRTQNTLIESVNIRLRYEYLNEHVFLSLAEARATIAA